MRYSVVTIAVLTCRVAFAQPVTFELHGEVNVGQKPQLQVRATENVTNLVLELDRDDGRHFTNKQASLAKGKAVVFSIGDGAPGKASYTGTLAVKGWTEKLDFTTVVKAPLKVAYDADHLDLVNHIIAVKPSRAINTAELTVIGDDGKKLSEASTTPNADAEGWYAIGWTQPDTARVLKLQLRVATSDGSATNLELIPWSVSIAHEDVKFATDSAVISPEESKKLDASYGKIVEAIKRSEKFIQMKLYIAGHTDTVGASAKNLELSFDRAAAIAQYFKKKGVTVPIAVAGFGEEVLKVKTADNTDEAANRRVDYVLGPAQGAPPFKGAYLRVKAQWKQLK